MVLINIDKSKILFAILFISVFITGCIEPIILMPMEASNKNSYQEFSIKNYKSSIRLTQITNDFDYLCSFKLVNNLDGTVAKKIKSTMTVKKYPTLAMRRDKHHHDKQIIISGIEQIIDSLSNDYDYKYKLTGKGKYELIIKLTEIEGKELDKDIHLIFDQEVK